MSESSANPEKNDSGGVLDAAASSATIIALFVTFAALAVAALADWDKASRRVQLLWRWGRGRLEPEREKCDEILFDDIRDGTVHVCHSIHPAHSCHQSMHQPGKQCWDNTLLEVFNQFKEVSSSTSALRYPRRRVGKDLELPPEKPYVRLDWDLIFAFIIMATDPAYRPPSLPDILTQSGDDEVLRIRYRAGAVQLDFSRVKRRGKSGYLLTLHANGVLQNKDLSKATLERIMRGEPPLYRDPQAGQIPSVRPGNSDDIKRGGWVAALGFDTDSATTCRVRDIFLPLYNDIKVEGYPGRGGVFWRSIDRVYRITKSRLLPSYPACRDTISRALEAFEEMQRLGTDTGVRQVFPELESRVSFSDADKRNIIALFNGSTRLSLSDQTILQTQFGANIERVLVAAVRGAMYCAAYVKNRGREMNLLFPELQKSTSEIWLRGC